MIDGSDVRATDDLVSAIATVGRVDVAIVDEDRDVSTSAGGRGAGADAPGQIRIGSGVEPNQALAVELGVRLAVGRGAPIEARDRRHGGLDELCTSLDIERVQPPHDPRSVIAISATDQIAGPAGLHIAVIGYASPAGPRQLSRLRERLTARVDEVPVTSAEP